MDYKFCPECGQKLPINATFCTNCGTKQPVNDDQVVNNRNDASQSTQPENQSTSETTTSMSSQTDANRDGDADGRRFSQVLNDQQPAPQPSQTTVNDEKATADQSQTANSEQPQFFNPQSRQQAHRQREQAQEDENQQREFYNTRSNQRSSYQQNTNSQSNQQGPAYAYNESENPGLNSSFMVWLNCLGKSNTCMGRADYWWGYLAFWLIQLIISFCIRFLLIVFPENAAIMLILSLIVWIVVSVFQIFATVERLHDTGHSGWNYLWTLTGIGAFYVLYLIVQPTNWNEQRWVRQ